MGGLSPIHLIILAVVVVLLLGGGRFSNLMGDVAKGVKQFKKGMAEEDSDAARQPSRIGNQPADAARPIVQNSADPAFDRDGNRVRDDR
ncbi:twin-arginine translocase TatA/TatE family subunit [Sphingomonas sp.]|uniref:twin-arginine translocase TatA/TatE family subunit n=1 Tax=Sphingomonas sp. TaxID=28214 RepID=UPI003CC626A0